MAFVARVLEHIPDQSQVTTRYDGWSANRPRRMRRQAEPVARDAPGAHSPAPRRAPAEAARRWAILQQQLFEVDPLMCCRSPARPAGGF
jgi:hypothetical protein